MALTPEQIAQLQALAVIEAAVGCTLLVKQFKEKITINFRNQQVFDVSKKPIKSLEKIEFLVNGDYKEVAIGKNFSFSGGNVRILRQEIFFNSCFCNFRRDFPAGTGSIRLTYKAGVFESVDDMSGVQKGVLETVAEYLETTGSGNIRSESLGSYSYTLQEVESGLTPTLLALVKSTFDCIEEEE